MLTGKYLNGIPEGSRASLDGSLSKSQLSEQTLAHVRALAGIAADRGQTLAQMAISRGAVSTKENMASSPQDLSC